MTQRGVGRPVTRSADVEMAEVPSASTHQSLTEEYLAVMAAGGSATADVSSVVRDGVVDSSYRGRALSRPVFLGSEEYRQLTEDLNHLCSAVGALPDRLFGGDAAAFARAAGMNEAEVSAVVRGHVGGPIQLARADLYLDRDGFRLLELNVGSRLGGLDNALLNRAMLADPRLEQFVVTHGLTYVDTAVQAAAALFDECGLPTGVRPVMAVAQGGSSTTPESRLRRSAAMVAPLGIDAYLCHVGDLRYDAGRVWLGERPVDVVYRLFGWEEALRDAGRAFVDPLLRAADRGEVKIFTPMDAGIYGSKAVLAMLSDEANRHLLSDAERASVDRLLPWTRILRSGPATVDGRMVDLQRYVLAHREQLILKPMLLYGGIGVVPGWLTGAAQWRDHVTAAVDGPYVVQRRIDPVVEWFPSDDGLAPWILVWAAFLTPRGAGGIWVRGSQGTVGGVVNMTQGSTATCCFHESV
jgi:hypothetical protein